MGILTRFRRSPSRLVGTIWQFYADPSQLSQKFLVQVLEVIGQEALVVAIDQPAFPIAQWRIPLREMLDAKFSVCGYLGTAEEFEWIREGAFIISKADGPHVAGGSRGAWRVRQLRLQQIKLDTKHFPNGPMTLVLGLETVLQYWRPATSMERSEAQQHYTRVEVETRRLNGTIAERLYPPQPVPLALPAPEDTEEFEPQEAPSSVWGQLTSNKLIP